MPSRTSERLKILMVAPTSFFADYGCHVRILEETRALQRLGHEVLICTYHNGNNVEGIPIRRSLDIPWRKRVVVGSSKHKIYLDAALSLTVMRAMRDFRPDLVHAHLHEGALIGGVAGRLFRRPVVFDYQGSLTAEMLDHGFLQQGSRFERFFRWLERRIDRLPETVITSSENARCTLEGNGHPKRPVETVFDAVDVHRFSPCAVSQEERAQLRNRLGIDAERPVVGYLGLLAPYQGSDLLLEAARTVVDRCPMAFFLIMGFPGDEAYRARAVSLGLGTHTSFPGRIPYRDAHRYLAIADLAVAPKLSMTEGNGKLYNYMAMGLPVVAFDAAANREILGDTGIYAELGSSSDLAEKIIQLIDDPCLVHSIGRQLRQRAVEALSWDQRVNELLDVYQRVLNDE